MNLTLKKLIKLEKWAREHTIEPSKVMTQKQADEMNADEEIKKKFWLATHKWKIGDRYYDLSKMRIK